METKNELKNLTDALEKVSARLIESIVISNQTATSCTPEMQSLFNQWINCIAAQVLDEATAASELDIKELAQNIGITQESACALLLTLSRRGAIEIQSMKITAGDGKNRDMCGCLGDI